MKPYADTNFLTRRYLKLAGSETGHRWLAEASESNAVALPITWLHRVELITSLESSVWLAKKGSHPVVSPQQAAIAAATFRADLVEKNFLYSAPLDPETLSQWAEDIALRHTAKHGFRTYDILHVALALLLKCDCFWTFDLQARKLAALEGLVTPG